MCCVPNIIVAMPKQDFSSVIHSITTEILDDARKAYRKASDETKQRHYQPDDHKKPFAFVTELRNKYPFLKYSSDLSNNPYLFFSSKNKYGKAGHNGKSFSYRLDEEGDTEKDGKRYVRLQLQNYSGQNNCYASILAPMDTPIHINLLYFSLQVSCVQHFKKSAESMEYYPDGEAKKPMDIYLDDPVFINKKKHIEKKNKNIQRAIQLNIPLKEIKKKEAARQLQERQFKERDENRKKPRKQKWA